MRNIVISGSASGIGQACREKFEAMGDRVIGIDIRDADIIADLATRDGRQQAIDLFKSFIEILLDVEIAERVCLGRCQRHATPR